MYSKETLFLSKLDEVKELIEQKKPRAEIARFLGVKYDTLTSYFKKYGIVYDGNQNRRGMPHNESRKSLDDILNNKIIYKATYLKKRLIEEGLKENKCEKCGISEWNGEELCLELHHIDGNHYNNNLNNLQILCPNCHSQTKSFRGRKTIIKEEKDIIVTNDIKDSVNEINDIIKSNIKPRIRDTRNTVFKKNNQKYLEKYCKYCGKKLNNDKREFCSVDCYNAYRAENAIRPNVMELMDILKKYNNNLTAVGKHYGVSDNAVKKWKKLYKI